MNELFPDLMERAMRIAAISHRDQQRKASPVPYLAHPASVALVLSQAGYFEPEILAAALLHDVIEDTSYTIESCRAEFPAAVVELVLATSEVKASNNGEKLPWNVRKREHLTRLQTAPAGAKAIVLADKYHNLTSMLVDLADGSELWSRFNASKDDINWYYNESLKLANDASDPRLQRLAAACRHRIAALWP